MRIKHYLRSVATMTAVAALTCSSLYASDTAHGWAKVTTLMQKALPDLPGKESLMLMV